jgi:hypothetical protein
MKGVVKVKCACTRRRALLSSGWLRIHEREGRQDMGRSVRWAGGAEVIAEMRCYAGET